jgi:hypothetical protein
MARVVRGFEIVMRKLFTAVALVLITGVFPAVASLGLCAARPCCRAQQSGPRGIGTNQGCCNETNCSQAAPGESQLTRHTKRTFTEQAVAVVVDVVCVPAAVIVRQSDRLSLGSPPRQQRLATLSLLLI